MHIYNHERTQRTILIKLVESFHTGVALWDTFQTTVLNCSWTALSTKTVAVSLTSAARIVGG